MCVLFQSCCIKYGKIGCSAVTDHFKSGKHIKKVLAKMVRLHLPGASDPSSDFSSDFGAMYGIPYVFQGLQNQPQPQQTKKSVAHVLYRIANFEASMILVFIAKKNLSFSTSD